jgi:hypothetical protein
MPIRRRRRPLISKKPEGTPVAVALSETPPLAAVPNQERPDLGPHANPPLTTMPEPPSTEQRVLKERLERTKGMDWYDRSGRLRDGITGYLKTKPK